MEVTITINDDLQERIDGAISELKELIQDYFVDFENQPDYGDLDYSGAVHEIIDSSVPIYTRQIDALWFLHKNDFIEAYEDSCMGNNPMEYDGMAAIYTYIDQELREWFSSNIDDMFDEFMENLEDD